MSLADDHRHAAAKRWANSANPDRATLAIDRNSVWVAEIESIVVGWIEVKAATVKGIYVTPSYSRSGVGSLLMVHAESAIQAKGEVSVHLDASPNALPFYSRLEYKVAGDPNIDNSVPMVKYFGNGA